VEAHERAITPLLGLTLLVVAAFLVSQAHGMIGARAGRLLYGFGVVFIGVAWLLPRALNCPEAKKA
jgi:hypothetical protein